MKTKKLTFIELLMLVAGAGIGTGILTIPYAIDKIGISGTVLSLALAYAVSAVYLITQASSSTFSTVRQENFTISISSTPILNNTKAAQLQN